MPTLVSSRAAGWGRLGHSKVLRMVEQKDGRMWVPDTYPGPLTAGLSDMRE